MTKKELQFSIKQQQEKLKELTEQLLIVEEDERRKKEIKDNYKLNEAPDRIEYNYKKLYEALKHELENHCNELIDEQFIETIEKEFSINYGPKPELVYPCPKCGKNNSLYIGEYSDDGYEEVYAITCNNCNFTGPNISDYGEAWVIFDEWLHTKGYLK